MSQRSSQAAIAQFWYMLEQLTLFDLKGATKNEKFTAQILETEEDRYLPWLNPEVLLERFNLLDANNGKPLRYEYQVFLGIFSSKSVIEFIKSLPKLAQSGFEDVVAETYSCYVSFKIDTDGLIIDDSLTCLAAPWALMRIGAILTSQQQLNIDTWTADFKKYVACLETEFSSRVKANKETNRKVRVQDIQGLLNLVSQDIWKPKELNILGYYVVQRVDRKKDDTVANIINSFYLDDLASAATAITAGTASPALQQFLTPTISNRLNVEETPFLRHWLSPRHLPLGRWASNPKYNLSLMQQLAVNLAIEKLKDDGGLFSVNGPPGTGKTTLLRDLIADLIVQRAEKMTNYLDPAAAFSKVEGFYRLHPSLTGFEIVVSSSNNAAVENVSVELPAFDAIDERYQERATYFRAVSESVKAAAQKQSEEPEINRSAPTTTAQMPILKKSVDSLADTPPSTWGLIAATLGKKDNCNKFCIGFWDKAGSINALLREEPARSDWAAARQDFYQCKQTVLHLIEQREKWYEQIKTQDLVSQQYRAIETSLDIARAKESEAKGIFKQALKLQLEAAESLKEREDYLKQLKSTQPSIATRLFDNVSYQQHHQKIVSVQQQMQMLASQLTKRTSAAEEVKLIFQRREREVQILNREKQQLARVMPDWLNLSLAKANLGEAFGDDEWWNQLNEKRQRSAPWVDEQLNQARTELFLAALNVHEQFIRQAAIPIKQNLKRWVGLVKGDREGLSDEQILYLWQTLFLVVPVVSTTLASVQRLFDRLPPAAFGWLLIDEAGQGIPQAVVGALQRSKRAIIVGDPSQIEPVFTLDKALVKELQNYFGVEDCWSPTEASIQTISDRANSFGTDVKVEGESKWIGCPLWVHRRCIEPMATISNQIAYEGKMVIATISPKEDKQFPLGDSRWIDIKSKCQDLQWVPAQGDEVVNLLTHLVAAEQAIPNLYIISPFKVVALKLKYLLQAKKSQWAKGLTDPDVKSWIDKSIGTVHTFQGKEADAVILVLGCDESSAGALNWASSKPNILNVAATRAKYRLYIVGDRQLWSKLKYFDEASDRLPHEVKSSEANESQTPRPIVKQKEGIPSIESPVLISSSNIQTEKNMENSLDISGFWTEDDYFEEGKSKYNLGDYEATINSFDRLIELNPQEASYYNWRAISKDNLGDSQGAIVDYSKAIELNSQEAIYFGNRGDSKYRTEDYIGAIHDFDKAIELNPQNDFYCNYRGLSKSYLKDYEGEIADYTKAIALNPQNADYYNNRGLTKYSIGDCHGAIADYTKAITLNPENADYYDNRSNAKYDLLDCYGAISDCTNAIKLDSQCKHYYNNRGVFKHTLGDYQGAIYDYEQSIKIDSQYPNPFFWRGFTKQNQNDFTNAIIDYDKAIELNPQYANAYSMRCFAKYKLKDYHGAITDFVQAIAYKPDSSVMENIQELERVISEAKSKLISSQLPSFSDRQIKIQNISQERGIENLIHFTHIENLNSILSDGLIPRTTLERDRKSFSSNDDLRLDGYQSSISLSVSFPNYGMFYKYRSRSNEKTVDWVVLELDPSILWKLESAFCYKNAASGEMTKISVNERKQPEYLHKMFDDNGQNRQDLNLYDNNPTDPQAEVLCFGSISPEYIKGVHFYSELDKDRWILKNGEHAKSFNDKFYFGDYYFTPRADYSFWTKKS